MSNPIHRLRQSIRLRSWSMVSEVYEELSGETAPEPVVLPSKEELPELRKKATEEDITSLVRRAVANQKTSVAGAPDETAYDHIQYPLVLGTEEDLAALTSQAILGEPTPFESTEVEYPIEPEPPVPAEALDVLADMLQSRQPEPEPEPQPEPAKSQVPPHRANIEDFRVQRQESHARSEGGQYTRAVPVVPIKNVFRDNLAVATRELRHDQILLERGVRPPQPTVESRNPPGMVTVSCRECGKPKKVLAADAPVRRLAKDDAEGATYICDGCIGAKAKTRRGN